MAILPLIVRHIHPSGISHGVRKNILLGVEKAKICLLSPKTDLGHKKSKLKKAKKKVRS
jgi:hypothetical protein